MIAYSFRVEMIPLIRAPRFIAALALVIFHKYRVGHDKRALNEIGQTIAQQYMIDSFPMPLIPVGAKDMSLVTSNSSIRFIAIINIVMPFFSARCHIGHTIAADGIEAFVVETSIEVACHYDMSIGIERLY